MLGVESGFAVAHCFQSCYVKVVTFFVALLGLQGLTQPGSWKPMSILFAEPTSILSMEHEQWPLLRHASTLPPAVYIHGDSLSFLSILL